jgi:hypothetical protein
MMVMQTITINRLSHYKLECVPSVKSVLIVGGGCTQDPNQHGSTKTDTIEIINPDHLQ